MDHRLLQPALDLFASTLVALDDNLVVAYEYRHGSGTLGSALPQESQGKVQAINSRPLDWSVEAVGQLL
jgi:hypothetical protein